MSVFASAQRFSLDALNVLRPSGEAAITASAASDNAYTLEILQSYWAAGDESDPLAFVAVFTVESAPVGTGTYVLSVQVSTASGFGSPVTIGSVTVTTAGTSYISITREQLVAALGGPDASLTGYLRAYATLGGTSPSIAWNCYLAPQVGL
jgi:hypothetical protein